MNIIKHAAMITVLKLAGLGILLQTVIATTPGLAV